MTPFFFQSVQSWQRGVDITQQHAKHCDGGDIQASTEPV